MTFVPETTGMKLVSPFHRGTMCIWKWPVNPAPATRPMLLPMLNASGLSFSFKRETESRTITIKSDLFNLEAVQISNVTVRGNHEVPSVIGVAVEHAETGLRPLYNVILPVVAVGGLIAKDTSLR